MAITVLIFTGILGSTLGADEPKKGLGGFRLDFVAYAGFGVGISSPAGEIVPRLDFSSGIQFTPWLGIGAFALVSPLSEFDHADFGISVANVPNAFNFASGLEILITPWSQRTLHPLFRCSVGGMSAGYGIDLDGDPHSLEQIVQQRFFSSSVSGGLELTLGRHFRINGSAGWRFVGNCEYLGIGPGRLSGFEAAISTRLVWHTVID